MKRPITLKPGETKTITVTPRLVSNDEFLAGQREALRQFVRWPYAKVESRDG